MGPANDVPILKPVNVPVENIKATVTDIGLSRKEIHEARIIRDAILYSAGRPRRIVPKIRPY
jgi:hypothetical protein